MLESAKEQDDSSNSGMDQSSPRDHPNLAPKNVSIPSSRSRISLPKRQEWLYSLRSPPGARYVLLHFLRTSMVKRDLIRHFCTVIFSHLRNLSLRGIGNHGNAVATSPNRRDVIGLPSP